ncbi:glycosyltransferase [Nibricoccus sp. IMCC34717]|uniref:glycosyltransferase n=1 Tax=Nibricoccus sp. IMCC34717 TaxID=3034021 RepID=UPI0038512AB0
MPETASASLPFVTVAIGTYKRARWLREALAFITKQDYPLDRWELIIVDNNSPDDTRAVVESFANAPKAPKYFLETQQGSSYARNRALQEMAPQSEIVLFTDDDVMGRSDWLRLMIEPLQRSGNENVAGVCGEVHPHFPDGLPRWLEGQFHSFHYRTDVGPLTRKQLPSTANVSLRRRVLDQVGWFRTDLGRLPNRLTAGEDNDLMRRIIDAGFTFWFQPHADLLHVVPAGRLTFKYACKLQYDASASRVVERAGQPGFGPWLATRILLYSLHIPLCALVGALCLVFVQVGTAKRWFTRCARAAGYVAEALRVLKRRALGQPVNVHA